jgi:hypothetical protein
LLGLTEDLSLYPAILESMDITVTFLGPGLASLPGCPGLSNPHPVVSLRSTTGNALGCLRHSFEELTNDQELTNDLSLYSGPREDLSLCQTPSLCQTDGVNGMTWVVHCGGSHTTGDLSPGWGGIP